MITWRLDVDLGDPYTLLALVAALCGGTVIYQLARWYEQRR